MTPALRSSPARDGVRPALALAAALLCGLWLGPPASGHGGVPRVEVTPERATAGVPVTLRGVDFPAESRVVLTLVRNGRARPLGTVTTDAGGGFERAVALPGRSAAGAYRIRARSGSDRATSAVVLLVGDAGATAPAAETNGRREEEESLLAPMPSATESAPAPPIAAADGARTTARSDEPVIAWLGVAAVVAALSGAVVARRRRRRPAP